MRSPIILASLWAALFAFGPGCSMMTKNSKADSPWRALQFWKKGYQQPTKMAVMWSHDVLSAPGTPPTRGFGGRIYFYNDRSQTIPVDGELIVHGFDDTQKRESAADKNIPDKRFRFTAEQFTKNFSESDIGASYSVWIPWDAVDGVQKEITLVPTFKGSKGEIVQGAPAKTVLPGRTAPGSQPVQTVSYEQSSEALLKEPLPYLGPPTEKRSETMRTTTIKLATPLDRRASTIHTNVGRDTNTAQHMNRSAMASDVATAQQNASANAAIEQARAKLIADAFRTTATATPAPPSSSSASTPNAWPNFVPPSGQLGPNYMPGPTGLQLPVNNMPPISAPMSVAPMNMPQTPIDSVQQMQRALIDENFGLPPGVQLTPRSPF